MKTLPAKDLRPSRGIAMVWLEVVLGGIAVFVACFGSGPVVSLAVVAYAAHTLIKKQPEVVMEKKYDREVKNGGIPPAVAEFAVEDRQQLLDELAELKRLYAVEVAENKVLKDVRQPSAIHLLFDGPPGPECGRFIEAEDPTGKGINAGKWSQRADGYWELVVKQPSAGEFGDAYQGAREDLAIWKRRALEAEAKVREKDQIIDHLTLEAQGETRLGEPAVNAGVVDEREQFERWLMTQTDFKLNNDRMEAAKYAWQARAQLHSPQGVGEAVAYAAFSENGNIRMWCRSAIGMCELIDEHGNKAVPLYTLPSDLGAVPVRRELLERASNLAFQTQHYPLHEEIRALLADNEEVKP